MRLPKQSPSIERVSFNSSRFIFNKGIEPSLKCYNTTDCTGRVIGERYDCHNCRAIGGKSLLLNSGTCQRC
ncbi:MAG: hypothetical protein HY819_14465 [Acidobacteria bacterium]|nr:hypothetical protein [Acidobacteriota bacterium]